MDIKQIVGVALLLIAFLGPLGFVARREAKVWGWPKVLKDLGSGVGLAACITIPAIAGAFLIFYHD